MSFKDPSQLPDAFVSLTFTMFFNNVIHFTIYLYSTKLFVDDEVTVVKVPPFAESLTEGDIRWDKGMFE